MEGRLQMEGGRGPDSTYLHFSGSSPAPQPGLIDAIINFPFPICHQYLTPLAHYTIVHVFFPTQKVKCTEYASIAGASIYLR